MIISDFMGGFRVGISCLFFEFGFDIAVVIEFRGWDFVDVIVFSS